MPLERAAKAPVTHRLRCARGQLDGVLRMLEDDCECADIVTQLASASRALHRAGVAMITASLEQTLRDGNATTGERARLERLFLTLG